MIKSGFGCGRAAGDAALIGLWKVRPAEFARLSDLCRFDQVIEARGQSGLRSV